MTTDPSLHSLRHWTFEGTAATVAVLLLSLFLAPQSAEARRRLLDRDPRDERALSSSGSRPDRVRHDPDFSDLRERDDLRDDSAPFSRAEIWQPAGRGEGGRYPLHEGRARGFTFLPRKKRPWSSTFFPFWRCRLAFQKFSPDGLAPMELYDTYVYNTTGRNPGAAAWEASPVGQTLTVGRDFGGRGRLQWQTRLGHNMAPWLVDQDLRKRRRRRIARVDMGDESGRVEEFDVSWWGHCPGWAAAAILRPEPPGELVVPMDDRVTQVKLRDRSPTDIEQGISLGPRDYDFVETSRHSLTFTRADLKGLLTEAYLSTAARLSYPNSSGFYRDVDAGTRYDGSSDGPRNDIEEAAYADIYPHNFHRILLDHMKREKGIVAEKNADQKVDNIPIIAYIYVRQYNRRSHAYDFKARVFYAWYDDPRKEGANVLPVDYFFRVNLNRDNRVTGSQWVGPSVKEHPDFIWVPDEPMPFPLKRNPAIKLDVLDDILAQAGGSSGRADDWAR